MESTPEVMVEMSYPAAACADVIDPSSESSEASRILYEIAVFAGIVCVAVKVSYSARRGGEMGADWRVPGEE